jgi:hypothetical protein
MKAKLQLYIIFVESDEEHEFHVREDSPFYDKADEWADGTVRGVPPERWDEFTEAAKKATGASEVDQDAYLCYYQFKFFSEDTPQIEEAKRLAQEFVAQHFYEKPWN